MHGSKNVNFTLAHQAKQIYQEKKTKGKLYKNNGAILYVV
jgi:hypothetical protein